MNLKIIFASFICCTPLSCKEKKNIEDSKPVSLPVNLAMDQNHNKIDESKLQHISSRYYHDGKNVYLKKIGDVGSSIYQAMIVYNKVEGASIDSFEEIDGTLFAKDKSSVFFDGSKIEDADPDSFTPVYAYYTQDEKETQFGKDNHSAFFQSEKIEGVDVNTFTCLSSFYSRDKNYIYHRSKKTTIDANTFVAVNTGRYSDYGYDNNFLYYDNQKIKTDGPPFSIGPGQEFRDKNSIYYLYSTIKITDKITSLKEILNEKTDQYWTQRPLEIIIKAKDKTTEDNLQQLILADFEEQLKEQHFPLIRSTYKLKGKKIRLYMDNYKIEYDAEPYGKVLHLTEDATLKYKEIYPEAGITEVLLVRRLHTD